MEVAQLTPCMTTGRDSQLKILSEILPAYYERWKQVRHWAGLLCARPSLSLHI